MHSPAKTVYTTPVLALLNWCTRDSTGVVSMQASSLLACLVTTITPTSARPPTSLDRGESDKNANPTRGDDYEFFSSMVVLILRRINDEGSAASHLTGFLSSLGPYLDATSMNT